MSETADFLRAVVARHAEMAEAFIRDNGDMSPMLVFSFGQMLMPVMAECETSADKDALAGFARDLTCAFNPDSVGFLCTAWASESCASAGVQPSESPDRREVLVVHVETPAQRAERICDIVRDAAGGVDIQASETVAGMDLSQGRFTGFYPDRPVDAAEQSACAERIAPYLGENVLAQIRTHARSTGARVN